MADASGRTSLPCSLETGGGKTCCASRDRERKVNVPPSLGGIARSLFLLATSPLLSLASIPPLLFSFSAALELLHPLVGLGCIRSTGHNPFTKIGGVGK